MTLRPASFLAVFALVSAGFSASAWAARDAAFLTPGGMGGGSARTEEAIVVEPKAEVDVGETPLNVGRRATFFFVNMSNAPVEMESLTANGDSNVRADIVADDCSKEKRVVVGSRCSVTVETTPTGAGSWTAELLMTHKAAGRIARARISGKTSNVGTQDKANTGLSLSTKDVKPVDFGDVEVGTGKAVRSALMINDSTEVISLQSIDVIAAENGLQRLEQGCLVDMDLKMGESCPVTLIWKPETRSNLSTDLIIRHTGRLGFVVVPIRGVAKESKEAKSAEAGKNGLASSSSSSSASSMEEGAGKKSGSLLPPVPTAAEIERAAGGTIPALPADALPPSASGEGEAAPAARTKKTSGVYRLIGTVGNRAIIYKPDGTTVTAAIGDIIDDGDGSDGVKIVDVAPKQVELYIDQKIKIIKIEAVSSLTSKAVKSRESSSDEDQPKKTSKKSSAKTSEADGNIVSLPAVK